MTDGLCSALQSHPSLQFLPLSTIKTEIKQKEVTYNLTLLSSLWSW